MHSANVSWRIGPGKTRRQELGLGFSACMARTLAASQGASEPEAGTEYSRMGC